MILSAPLKIEQGSGSPTRVLALVPAADPASAAGSAGYRTEGRPKAR